MKRNVYPGRRTTRYKCTLNFEVVLRTANGRPFNGGGSGSGALNTDTFRTPLD
jgi:hypothetical protein